MSKKDDATKQVAEEQQATATETTEEVIDQPAEESEAKSSATKKAGPKAQRAKAEAEEEGKEEAKAAVKQPQKPARPRIERRGKKYQEATKSHGSTELLEIADAAGRLKNLSTTNFDSSVELHINLNVDPKQADQMLRGTTTLPHGNGKTVRIAVLASGNELEAAKKAGADVAGDDDLLEAIGKGTFDFDVLVATPAMMGKLGRFAKELGPRGLMPNPKSGTVTDKPEQAVSELKAGRLEFRMDKSGIVHMVIGKSSFEAKQLEDNLQAALHAIQQAKPSGVKGALVKSAYVTTTMGPSLKLDLNSIK